MEKICRLALICVGLLSAIVLFFCFIEYIFPVLLPFAIAWIIASVTVSPAKRLSERIKAPERIIRLVMSVVFTLIFAAVGGLTVWRVLSALWSFLTRISEKNSFHDLLAIIMSRDIPILGELLPEELGLRVGEAVGNLISEGLTSVAEWITSLAAGLPRLFLFLLVTLISLVYFSLDYDRIADFIRERLPKRVSVIVSRLRLGVFTVIKKYLLSYSLILLITYATLLIGFLVLRVKNALTLAFFISLLDILPIIGVGTVLVPWSIYELAVGNGGLGVGLILLFVINAIIRQLCEPKIVGKSLNIHPIVTLILLYVGYALLGIWGMLLLPILAVLISAVLKGDNTAEIS